MMNQWLLCSLFSVLFFPSFSQTSKWSENDYADYIQLLIGGQREVSVDNGRVDLVTDSVAYEIEWAEHWKESIGQSLWYALQTNKRPGIIIIMKSTTDYKYFIRLNSALTYAGLHERVITHLFPSDFQELVEQQRE